MTKLYFKLHHFLTFSVQATGIRLKKFQKEFSYYQVDEVIDKPHIEVEIGDFDWHVPEGSVVVNKLFHLYDDVIMAKDSYKVARWKVKITGLESEHTKVQIDGNRPSNLILARWFCETVIRLKMTLVGCPMIHSSCLCDGQKGIVMGASPSTGKTTSLLTWLENGHPFCSDEYSILDQGKVWSYVTPFRFHSHNLDMNPILAKNIALSDRLQIRWRTALLKASGGYADVTWDLGIKRAMPHVKIVQNCELSGVFALTRSQVDKVEFREDPIDDVIKRLQIINKFEWRGFEPYIRAWSYVHPTGQVAHLDTIEREGFRRIMQDRKFGEIRIPARFNQKTFGELIQKIGTF